jgi:hypothetical protein
MEICNGEDDDCDGTVDEGFDKDGDKYTTCGGDCDDKDANVHPDAVERCDGIDNNCNGLIDDGFNVGGPCMAGLGECAREGKRRCQASGLGTYCDAQVGEKEKELCDNKDNDCNGQVDDGLGEISCGVGGCRRTVPGCVAGTAPQCRPGEPSEELCGDKVDNDCDGEVDEGFPGLGKECFAGVGGCRQKGKMACSEDGKSLVCSAVPSSPVDEICGNGIDDDCDGEVDTDVLGLGDACDNGLSGECRREGKKVCDKKTGELVCSAPRVGSAPERCDGKDNDCDGQIDEDLSETASCGKGLCAGGSRARECKAGEWGQWSECSTSDRAIEEICGNGVDDDCDGTVDSDAAGLGDKCDNGLVGACHQEGKYECVEGGRLVCSAKPLDPSEEICNGIDDDCDGTVDEGVTNACGGCGELPGVLGEPCHVPGGDECAAGVFACTKGNASGMECTLAPKLSDGKVCEDDGNPCTQNVCRHGACEHPPAKDGTACDDGNTCTVEDMCVKGVCTGGGMLSCEDDNACTIDSCDPVKGCFHTVVGGGVPNVCGGCDVLKFIPGQDCKISGASGICSEGIYVCQPDGTINCVQGRFMGEEVCNGLDDNCDGAVDEGFGSTTCGVGKCQVTVENCVGGKLTTCVPRDPLPETCSNMKADDDCNGVVDDIRGIDEECPVAMGTCIIPGRFKCVGDAEYPVCVVTSPKDAEDDDDDGVPNYCDNGGQMAGNIDVEVSQTLSRVRGGESTSRLYDLAKTRAAMLPWHDIIDAVVIVPDSPDQAMLILSGMTASQGGLAAIHAKKVTASGAFTFDTCMAPEGRTPERMITAGDVADIIASFRTGYVRYPKIASQLPTAQASDQACMLKPVSISDSPSRTWQEKEKDVTCDVERVWDIAKLSDSPLAFAGIVSCRAKSGSIWKTDRRLVGLDVVSERADKGFDLKFTPLFDSDGEFSNVRLATFSKDRMGFIAMAYAKNKGQISLCTLAKDAVNCQPGDIDPAISAPVYLGPIFADGLPYIISQTDIAYEITFDDGAKKMAFREVGKVAVSAEDGQAYSISEFPSQKDRPKTLLVGLGKGISAALVKDVAGGGVLIRPDEKELFLPESVTDDVFVGEKLDLRHPHSMVVLPLKNFGGRDLFVAFDIVKGFKKIGEMGFFYWNANERPSGSVTDVSFDGRKGKAKLVFEDPTGDRLRFRASIRANHGGSLDNWIDGFENGVLRFSAKGDTSAVGFWPIKIRVEASDPGGLVSVSNVVLERDGTVEVISEGHGGME